LVKVSLNMARSLMMSVAPGDANWLTLVDLLREFAESRRRHPAGGLDSDITQRLILGCEPQKP
jgi:hypothetical protein